MKKIAIVVLLDKATNQKAVELSSILKEQDFTLASSKAIPHISLCHLTEEPCDISDAIAKLSSIVTELAVPTLIAGIMSNISHVRGKWVFWNAQEHCGLTEIQKQIYKRLACDFQKEDLDKAYPYQKDRFSPHITLGVSTLPTEPRNELRRWVGCELSVVSLGEFGEIIETFMVRNIFTDQVSHVLQETVPAVSRFHALSSKNEMGAFRKHDKKTPYGVHPALCALTILHEKSLSESDRLLGAILLAYHDVLEDTQATLPPELPHFLTEDIKAMCFESSSHEMLEIWTRPTFILMLKLYDKWGNLYDSSMNPLNKEKYRNYTKQLSTKVKDEYPNINIHAMIDAVISCN